jgi:glycosyltransferase involved in cell wall biosynthesis
MTTSKPRLAVISTYDDLCGIAGYTKPIVKLLEEYFDVTVFDLDQFLFKNKSPLVQRMAEQELQAFCKTLHQFDAVNLQLEHGTLGNTARSIFRRLKLIVKSSPNITITFHTMLTDLSSPGLTFLKDCLRGRPGKGFANYRKARHDNLLAGTFYGFLRQQQKQRRISLIVHTRRDARLLKVLYRLKNVHDHPLASLTADDAKTVLANASRDNFPALRSLPAGSVVLGCFGFLSRYKGVDTALKAMQLLPENYHLAIFGATHPNTIVEQATIDPFVKKLMKLVNPERTMLDAAEGKRTSLTLNGNDLTHLVESPHPTNLTHRVHFMGALNDVDFPSAMAVCDTILLPYLEVGQSSSGPLNWSIALGKHIISSRNKTFLQALRYYPGRFRTFDIGNYVELAEAAAMDSRPGDPRKQQFPFPENYSTETNIELYRTLLMPDRLLRDASRNGKADEDVVRMPARRNAAMETVGGSTNG